MNADALQSLAVQGLTSTPHREGDSIVVTFQGNADLTSTDLLVAHLAIIHEESLRIPAGEVVVDFKALEFMSSSCLKAFVEWISTILEAPLERRYRVRFRSNRDLRWQRRSLQSLRCFASDLVTVED